MPKVSIIIPIYNQEKCLEKCLQSLISQTIDDVEVILVNDGSIDNSESIAKDFTQKYSYINYFYQETRGVSVARNKGMEEAKGEYLYFLDSDDTLSPHFLEDVYKKAKQINADFVVCGRADWQKGLETPPCICTGSIFVKKELVEKYQIRFPVRISPCEDSLFSHFCFAVAEKVIYFTDAEYFYRDYETSHEQVGESQSNVIYEQLPRWLNIIVDFYNKHNLWDKKALHLIMFFQKEPFARYINNEFSYDESKTLYNILQDFYIFNIKRYETNTFEKHYTKEFKQFLSSKFFLFYVLKVFVKSITWRLKRLLTRKIWLLCRRKIERKRVS